MVYIVTNIRRVGTVFIGDIAQTNTTKLSDLVPLGEKVISFYHGASAWAFENCGVAERLYQIDGSEVFVCADCGKTYKKGEGKKTHQKHFCSDCLDTCPRCGKREAKTFLKDTPDGKFCEDCFELNYFVCTNCSSVHRKSEAIPEQNEGNLYCSACAQTELFVCNNCHRHYANSFRARHQETIDEYGVICRRCEDNFVNNVIRGYHDRPEMIFHGDGSKHFGLELEVSGGGFEHINAKKIRTILGKEHVYFNRDGSINNGFEIITHPHSYTSMMELDWESACNALIDMGYEDGEPSTGTHVHVSRSAFGRSNVDRDLNYSKILFFFEKYWNKILKFSRRKESEVERWASRYGFDMPEKILEKAKSSARYRCVNLNNSQTIEFRVFKGTIDPTEIRAIIEFCELLTTNIKKIPVQKLPITKFSQYFEGMSENLFNKFVERGCLPKRTEQQEISFDDVFEKSGFKTKFRGDEVHICSDCDGNILASISKKEFCLAYGNEKLADIIMSEVDKERFKKICSQKQFTLRNDLSAVARYYEAGRTDFGTNPFLRPLIGKKINVMIDPTTFASFDGRTMFTFTADSLPFIFTEVMFEELHGEFDGN